MEYELKQDFNCENPNIMHIDINSCFATVEQQYDPSIRNKPVVIAPNYGDHGHIVAASREAKPLGIKTGMRVFEVKQICPNVIILEPNFIKYRTIHNKLRELLDNYSPSVIPKSIDEFVVDLNQSPQILSMTNVQICKEIKERLTKEVGDWITVSIGLGPNRFLAKTGAGLKKPDGLETICEKNYLEVFRKLKLTDLCGINTANSLRLNKIGIYSVEAFYLSSYQKLQTAFKSLGAFDWYMKLRGWEVDNYETSRSTFGHSYVLKEKINNIEDLKPLISKMSFHLGQRLREANYSSRGVAVSIYFHNNSYITNNASYADALSDGTEIYKKVIKLISSQMKNESVKKISITCFHLQKEETFQLDLFGKNLKQSALTKSIDEINQKWGEKTITPSIMLAKKSKT